MRLEINAGGLDSFFNGVSSFINADVNTANSNSLINSFQTVVSKTNSLNGGVGVLGTALGYIQTCKASEEARIFAVQSVKEKTDNFIQTAIRIDAEVAEMVSCSQEAFYKTNPWLRPPSPPPSPTLLDCIKDGADRFFESAADVAKKCWDGVVKFVKSPIGKIIIGVVIIAALVVATVLTGGLVGTICCGALIGACVSGTAGAVIGGLIAKQTGGNVLDAVASGFMWGTISGAISGAVGAAPIGVAGQVTANAAISTATYVGQTKLDGGKVSIVGLVFSAGGGAIAGRIGGAGLMSKGEPLANAFALNAKTLLREARRANTAYAEKQIARCAEYVSRVKFDTLSKFFVKVVEGSTTSTFIGSQTSSFEKWLKSGKIPLLANGLF